MPTLAHLLFGGAIAILIAIVLVLFLPGSQESSAPKAQIISSPLPIL
jgi:hypothetical protein